MYYEESFKFINPKPITIDPSKSNNNPSTKSIYLHNF